jgi:hypothetical protein
MTAATPGERSLRGSIAGHLSWANTEDRSARTAPARAALDQKFLDQAGGDPVRAAHYRKAYFKQLALRSAQARRKIKDLTTEAEAAEAELTAEGGGLVA